VFFATEASQFWVIGGAVAVSHPHGRSTVER
jgi:hypothetical protein